MNKIHAIFLAVAGLLTVAPGLSAITKLPMPPGLEVPFSGVGIASGCIAIFCVLLLRKQIRHMTAAWCALLATLLIILSIVVMSVYFGMTTSCYFTIDKKPILVPLWPNGVLKDQLRPPQEHMFEVISKEPETVQDLLTTQGVPLAITVILLGLVYSMIWFGISGAMTIMAIRPEVQDMGRAT